MAPHVGSMELRQGGAVISRIQNTPVKKRSHFTSILLGKGGFHRTGARGSVDAVEGRMILTRGAGQKLGAEEVRVLLDGKHFGLTMDVRCRGHLMAASDDAKSIVLDRLRTALNDALLDDGPPNASGIGESRPHIEVERRSESPEIASPLSGGDGLEDGKASGRLGPKRLDMGPKGKMGVPDNSKKSRLAFGRLGVRAFGRSGIRAFGHSGVLADGHSGVLADGWAGGRAFGRSGIRAFWRTGGRADGRADGRMDGRTNGQTGGRVDGRGGG